MTDQCEKEHDQLVTVTMTTPGITGDAGGMSTPPDPEVPAKARRRRFSAEYKLAILREADACTQSGDAGALQALARRRGRPPVDPAAAELARLRRANQRLAAKLAQAQRIIEIQGK